MCDRAQFLAMLAGAAGGAIAIASMEGFSASTAFPLVAIPFATSIVTVLGSPKAEPAQPRALVGGHLVSTLVGLLIVKLCGPAPWAAALAVGAAMVAMHLTGTFHPRPESIRWSWSPTTCPGAFWSCQSASARCYSRCSPLLGTISSREAPIGVILGLYGGGEGRRSNRSTNVCLWPMVRLSEPKYRPRDSEAPQRKISYRLKF